MKKSKSARKIHLVVTKKPGSKKPTIHITDKAPTRRSKSQSARQKKPSDIKTNPPIGGGYDVCPPMYTMQYGGHAYFCTLKWVDGYSGYCHYECIQIGTAGPYDPTPSDPNP
jgi:hypothetical protein